ncbi:TPA: hypothetical protein ACGIZN_001641 [Corynebacterium striatum]|nr:hypothetical protein [Corynebacterium striatum]HAT6625294.1 hypothetical protein [Corynebacterium striatum]HDV6349134.1 hypothetical protein [Corynebacterium striatum]
MSIGKRKAKHYRNSREIRALIIDGVAVFALNRDASQDDARHDVCRAIRVLNDEAGAFTLERASFAEIGGALLLAGEEIVMWNLSSVHAHIPVRWLGAGLLAVAAPHSPASR